MIIIIVALLVIIVILVLALAAAKGKRQAQGNLNRARAVRQEAKEGNKRKILELFNSRPSVTNDDVQKLLQVSDATASNYLQELETAGLIVQTASTGRGVTYEKNRRNG